MKYTIGEIVKARVPLEDEEGKKIEAGAKLRIVDIAPKVCKSTIRDAYHDGSDYFYNAVRADQVSDGWPRIRASFCTIQKEKPMRSYTVNVEGDKRQEAGSLHSYYSAHTGITAIEVNARSKTEARRIVSSFAKVLYIFE